ncbi:MAG: hypothetical protein AMS20_16080, partial [Gemmatimonas sp. SG8_28]
GRRAVGFGLNVLYADRDPQPEFERETNARRVDLPELLARAAIVTLHVPSTQDTRGMVNGEWFGLQRDGALLVNTARGDIVDEPALLAALVSGRLAGAGLDVFPSEPAVHPALVAHPRVVTLPHLGSATVATRRAMAMLAVRNVRAVLAGERPLTPVPSGLQTVGPSRPQRAARRQGPR